MNFLRATFWRITFSRLSRRALMISRPAITQTDVQSARSPVDSFRELLVMPSEVAAETLTKQLRQSRQRILEKIREYSSLSPEDGNCVCRATELGWYLTRC